MPDYDVTIAPADEEPIVRYTVEAENGSEAIRIALEDFRGDFRVSEFEAWKMKVRLIDNANQN